VTRGGDGIGSLITCLVVILHSNWSSGLRDSGVTLLVIPPLVELAGHRPLQAVDLSFQSGVPGDLPPPLQPVLQAYLILNAGRYRRPWVIARATLGSRCRQSLQNSAGEVLNAHVDCHPVVQFQIKRNLTFQVSLEVAVGLEVSFYTVLLLFFLLCYWLAGRVVGMVR